MDLSMGFVSQISKARLNLAEQEIERMQAKGKTTELLYQLAHALQKGDEGEE